MTAKDGGMALEKIEMGNIDQCENKMVKLSERWSWTKGRKMKWYFACVTGK